jgi:hypothetical protein
MPTSRSQRSMSRLLARTKSSASSTITVTAISLPRTGTDHEALSWLMCPALTDVP